MLGDLARHTATVFTANLGIQVTTFVVIAASAAVLPTEAFARLSIIIAATMLSTALFDLGLSLTMTKRYVDSADEAFLRSALAGWLATIPAAVALGAVAVVAAGAVDIALGIVLGAVLNVWNGVRAADQARQDYSSYGIASLAFGAVRLTAGLLALLVLRDPIAIAVAVYAVPVIVSPMSTSFRYVASALTGTRRPMSDLLWYATFVYLNAVAFIAVPYIPQFIIASRLEPSDIGAYGLILTFSAPVSLLVQSLRSVLLPKMLGSTGQLENMLWSLRGLALIAVAWALLFSGCLLVGFALEQIYADKYPRIQWAFVLFFAGYSVTALLGLYSLSVHTQSVPHFSMIINTMKLAILAPIVLAYGHSLMVVIGITAVVMVLGELVLIAVLAAGRESPAADRPLGAANDGCAN